jgi:DNA-binding transcriptional ArsR family regulator
MKPANTNPLPSADRYAVAIVASARAYGDDPLAAVIAVGPRQRRCLAAALMALSEVHRLPLSRLARPLGASASNVARSMARPGGAGLRARLAVLKALAPAASPAPQRDGQPGPKPVWAAPPIPAPPPPVPPPVPAPPPVVAVAAPPAPPPSPPPAPRLPAGPISAALSSYRPTAAFETPWSGLSLGERVLALLEDGHMAASTLAIHCETNELAVSRELSVLEHAGQVEALPIPPEGRRARRWRLTAAADPAPAEPAE